jgi:hypothetical protein
MRKKFRRISYLFEAKIGYTLSIMLNLFYLEKKFDALKILEKKFVEEINFYLLFDFLILNSIS